MSRQQDDTSIRIFISAIKSKYGIDFVQEYKFHPTRKWRADLACVEHMILIEVEGGAFSNGRHTRGLGFISDIEKYNNAVCLGWKLIRVTPDRLLTLETFKYVEQLIIK